MNKKVLLIIIASLTAVLTAVLITVFAINHGKVRLFTDTDYPLVYKQKKDSSVTLKIKAKTEKSLDWTIEADEDIVDIKKLNKGKNGKLKISIKPKKVGYTELTLRRTKEFSKDSYDVVKVVLPLVVSESNDGYKLVVREDSYIDIDNRVYIAENTDNSFVVENNKSAEPVLRCINETDDWQFEDLNKVVSLSSYIGENDKPVVYISAIPNELSDLTPVVYDATETDSVATETDSVATETDSIATESDSIEDGDGTVTDATPAVPFEIIPLDASVIYATPEDATIMDASTSDAQATPSDAYTYKEQETKLKISSESLGVTIYVDVRINSDGTLELSEGKAPKE